MFFRDIFSRNGCFRQVVCVKLRRSGFVIDYTNDAVKRRDVVSRGSKFGALVDVRSKNLAVKRGAILSRPLGVERATQKRVVQEGAVTMLVLSRYKDQSIYIGDDIVVTIVDVRGDRIRLGIEAPPNVPVHRQEIYEAIQRENSGELEVESVEGGVGVQTLERTRTVTARAGSRTSSADYEVKLR